MNKKMIEAKYLDFQDEIDRFGTGSVKWGLIQDLDNPKKWLETDVYQGEASVLPMWVADMDFRCPEPVVKALEERSRHGVYGYTMVDDTYLSSVTGWMQRRHNWLIEKEWIVTCPGVVPALHMLVQALTDINDQVLIQRPVYYPFFAVIKENGRTLVSNSLVFEEGKYLMDWQDLKSKLAHSTLIILCNPHNPVGRVWSRDELLRFGRLCKENDVTVIADEIHGDLMIDDQCFIPFASLEDFAEFTITCTAPSKTFNLAGLHTSNIIISNGRLRTSFKKQLQQNGLMGVNPFGMTACQTAYDEAEPWLDQLLVLLNQHVGIVENYFHSHLPDFKLIRPQGTYLLWFDCNSLGLDHMELRRKFLSEARIFLDDGFIFGEEGNGFQRINVACPTTIVLEALKRIKQTFYPT